MYIYSYMQLPTEQETGNPPQLHPPHRNGKSWWIPGYKQGAEYEQLAAHCGVTQAELFKEIKKRDVLKASHCLLLESRPLCRNLLTYCLSQLLG